MISATITIDGKGYYGEEPEQSSTPEHGQERDHLRLERGTGKLIEGCLCLKTELEKILRYVKDGHIRPREIRVMMIIK